MNTILKKEYDKQWWLNNKERLTPIRKSYRTATKASRKEYFEKYYSTPKNRIHRIALNAIRRSIRDGKEYDKQYLLSLELNPPDKCACCNSLLDYSCNRSNKAGQSKKSKSPSIDRVDNSLGYTKENTAIICMSCNQLKSDASIATIENMLNYMKKHSLKGIS